MLGFLLIDKPQGITSFRIVQVLRRLLGIRRIGYAGTLDPLATGLMIVAIGEATKFLPYLERMDKAYEVQIHFGGVSTTYDATGEITEMRAFHDSQTQLQRPSQSQIEEILCNDFLGNRLQTPPIFSAIKIGGKRAYSLARKGVDFELKQRPVNFFELLVTDYQWPFLSLKVHCSSGTYIRSLAHDLGQKLSCGGYVEALRRTKIDDSTIENAIPFDTLNSQNIQSQIIPPDQYLKTWPHLDLEDGEYRVLEHGGFISKNYFAAKTPIIALWEGRCVGMLEFFSEAAIHSNPSSEKSPARLKFLKKFNIM